MRISLITTTNSHLAGGLYNSVRQLSLSLLKNKVDVDLLSYNDKYSEKDMYAYGSIPMRIYKRSRLPWLKRLGYSSNLIEMLKERNPNIIHSQGLWMYNSYATWKFKNCSLYCKTVISPRGMLDSWALKNSKIKKKIVGLLFENKNLKEADCIHVLCKSEYESIRSYGLKNAVAIIPNGIELPKVNIEKNKDKGKKVLLFISRIHPKKGLKEFIEGINILKNNNQFPKDWVIRIAGWNQNKHQEFLESLITQYGLEGIVEIIGPVLSDKKEYELLNADAFILPSFSEGLPMSVLEAWSYKLPVVMTEYCNLPEGFNHNAAVRIDPNPSSIANGLKHLFEMTDDQRIDMGNRGYELVKNRFTWDVIAEDTIRLYRWILGKGEKPEFVFTE